MPNPIKHSYPETASSHYYPFLDGFRALAVSWVILHHIFVFFNVRILFGYVDAFFSQILHINITKFIQSVDYLCQQIAFSGNLGVDMFFVISGFLITGLLIDTPDGKLHIGRFYIRRFFKIYPQYFFAVIVGMIVFAFTPPTKILGGWFPQLTYVEGTSLTSYFIFFQNYSHQIPMLAHTWSLVIEEQFYFFYPLILSLLYLIPQSPERRRNMLIMVGIVLIALFNLNRYYYFHAGKVLLTGILHAPMPMMTTLFRGDGLILGCFLRLCEPYYKDKQGPVWNLWIPALCWIAGLGIYFGFIIGPMTVGQFTGDRWYTYTLAYLAPGFILFAAIKGMPFIANNKFLRWIGKNSYGIYLWHYILIFPFALLGATVPIFLLIPAYVFTAYFVGIVTTMTIERTALKIRSQVIPSATEALQKS